MKKLETWFENRLFIALNIAIEDFCAKSATKMFSPFEGHRLNRVQAKQWPFSHIKFT